MNMQTLDLEVFMRSLTEEQMDACESDEKKLGEIFEAGWSENTAVRFHRAMLSTRRIDPEVTVDGVLEVALWVGLSFLGNEGVFARLKQNREDDVVVYGVARRDGKDLGRTSGTVLMDGDMPARLRRGKNSRKNGVRVVGVPGNKHGRAGVSIREV
jgi:hypothetical protein